jgi:Possible lysine decarboxylase
VPAPAPLRQEREEQPVVLRVRLPRPPGQPREPRPAQERDYWAPLLEFLKNTMLGRGYIGASELALLRVADDPEDVVKIIKEAHKDLEF